MIIEGSCLYLTRDEGSSEVLTMALVRRLAVIVVNTFNVVYLLSQFVNFDQISCEASPGRRRRLKGEMLH